MEELDKVEVELEVESIPLLGLVVGKISNVLSIGMVN